MRTSRRDFLQIAAATTAAAIFPPNRLLAYYQTPGAPIRGQDWPGVSKFATALRGVGPGGIPVAQPDATPALNGATHFSLRIGQYTDRLHPDFEPTTLRGYSPAVALGEGAYPTRHLGSIVVAQKNTPIQLTFTNALPPDHIVPVDVSGPMPGGFPDAAGRYGGSGFNAAVPHLHGGFTPWISDGGPMAWFTPDGHHGSSFMRGFMESLNPALATDQAEYYYPNQQSARLMWYHDHAHEITRLNAYAGLATAYIIRDGFEAWLRDLGLPDFIENGGREIPLVVQDKIFVGPGIGTADPTWTGPTTAGSLWYPHTYEKKLFHYQGNTLMPDPSCVPEMFGDTMLVNGTVYPVATVEARRYRFRMLNACQARFLNLQLYVADASPDGITYRKHVPVNQPGPGFLVIGAEGGFLPHPVAVPAVQPFDPLMLTSGAPNMLAAPAERFDFIVDFGGFAGKSVILYSDAPAPFPDGDADNDFNADKQNGVTTRPGYGPDTRILMRFDVVGATSPDSLLAMTPATDLTGGLEEFIVPPGVAVQNGVLNLPPGVPVRSLTLIEAYDGLGRLYQLLGTDVADELMPGAFGREYMGEVTEAPLAGTTEVWQIANLTGDTHPIHFHLVNVQMLGRQPFDVKRYEGAPIYTGPPRNPDPTELGWKDTVRMNPGEVTTVIMRFDLPSVPFTVPSSPRTGGAEYVWHCHILEHEEHDMMRPLVVI